MDDAVLLREYAATRSAEAFGELARRYAGLVYRTCLRVTGNPADAEDVSQECFMELARRAGEIRNSPGGWLHSLARSRSVDVLRREGRRRQREQDAATAGRSGGDVSWKELAPVVDEAVHALPEDLREPIVLHYLHGQTQAEIAGQLGVSQPAVCRRLEKGVEQLREALKRAGVVASVGAVAAALAQSASAAPPAALVASLAKMAVAGVGTSSIAPGSVATAGATRGVMWMKLGIIAIVLAAVVLVVRQIGTSAPMVSLVTQPTATARTTQESSMDLANGLVAHYRLDGDAKDASGKGLDGKVIGATPAKDRFGRDGRACAFNGVDNEIVVDPPPVLSSKAMSVSVWVRFDLPRPGSIWNDVTDGVKLRDPIAGQDDGFSLRSWQLCVTEDKKNILWHRLGEYSSAWWKTPVEADKWYHIAAVWDGAQHTLYVDGEEKHRVEGIFKSSRDEPLRIGSKGSDATKRIFFAGAIDELRLYDRELSAEEIAALYREPQAGANQMDNGR